MASYHSIATFDAVSYTHLDVYKRQALYNAFHSKGLNIIGVSLDEDLSKWKDAIAKDKITWTQVSNLKGWQDPIAKPVSYTHLDVYERQAIRLSN